jgi:uncharacterized protein YdiU (UPF0061 family)
VLLPGSEPAAHCYCGHQFGAFSGQLGDGATMYLGEVLAAQESEEGAEAETEGKGRPVRRTELQFKGAGKTPYSRTADGRKVLRSSIREFLCSELMHALGVPTTRAATVVTSDTRVERDVYYTGDPILERATVITRLAPTFLRFGSFEIFKPEDDLTGWRGPSMGRIDILETMLEYVCKHFYSDAYASAPPAAAATPSGSSAVADSPAETERKRARWTAMYLEIVRRTARLVAHWQAHGWCHGVLNTDNMSIVGLTLDYGPFGWMDRYDPGFICNASDPQGRYSYRNQPNICRWNCAKLAESFGLHPALDAEALVDAMGPIYDAAFEETYNSLMQRKLGLLFPMSLESSIAHSAAPPARPDASAAANSRILDVSLRTVMEQTGADYTNTFRILAAVDPFAPPSAGDGSDCDPVLEALLDQTASPAEMAGAEPDMPLRQLEMMEAMAQRNPRIAAHLDEIRAEIERHQRRAALMSKSPEQKRAADRALWTQWLSDYRGTLGNLAQEARTRLVSVVAAGSANAGSAMTADAEQAARTIRRHRLSTMLHSNAKFVLRNWVAQRAILKAEAGSYGEVRAVLAALQDPYALTDPAVQQALETGDAVPLLRGTAPAASGEQSTTTATTSSVVSAEGTTCAAGLAAITDYSSRPPVWAQQLRVT